MHASPLLQLVVQDGCVALASGPHTQAGGGVAERHSQSHLPFMCHDITREHMIAHTGTLYMCYECVRLCKVPSFDAHTWSMPGDIYCWLLHVDQPVTPNECIKQTGLKQAAGAVKKLTSWGPKSVHGPHLRAALHHARDAQPPRQQLVRHLQQ